VAYHRFHSFFGFGVEGVIGQIVGVEVEFDLSEIRNASRDDSGFVSGATELKVFFDYIFQLFLQLLVNQVSGRRYDYWWRPTCFARNCLLV
jgi:hypothetical protein